jgi:RNA polymerase sigma-70 factor (ECF subfamily)
MPDPDPHGNLVARLRAGDPAAADRLVREYEPVIRSWVRVWLRRQDARLRRLFDSVDVCQSVLASFFVRAAAGQYDLDRPEQLTALLVQMAKNKLSCEVRRQTARRRDVRRTDAGGLDGAAVAAADPTPSAHCAGRELLQEVRSRLSDEERRIADRRAGGDDWAAIAADLGGTPDGRRMQLARALDRVTEQLGLDEPDKERP